MQANNAHMATSLQGLGYVSSTTGSISVGSFSFGAGATSDFETTVTGIYKSASLVIIKFSGVGNATWNNKWMLLPGAGSFRNTGPSYDMGFMVERTTSGQRIRLQFYNPTGGSVTVPAITVSIKTYYYSAPW